jgi:serine/threonine protein kinase
LQEGNHTAGDIWALGVTLLVLLSGRHPDFTSNKIDVGFELHNIKKETSEVCRDFLKRCLEIDPSKRIKA